MKRIDMFLKSVLACLLLSALCASRRTRRVQEVHGIAVDNIDRSVKPGDDFYRFANGNWIKRTEIPPDRAGIDVLTKLDDLSSQRTADLIKELAVSNPPAGSNLRKVADLFNSYMDEAAIEAKGLTPVKPQLDAIAAIHDKKQLAHALGETLTRRCGRAEQHQLSHSKSFWAVGGAGVQRFGPLHALPDAGRAAATGPRVLHLGQREHAEDTRGISAARSRDVEAGWIFRCGCARGSHRGTGDCNREDASHAGGERRHPQGEQHVETRGVCDEGSGTRLGRILQGSRAQPCGEFHRVAARSISGRVGAGGIELRWNRGRTGWRFT